MDSRRVWVAIVLSAALAACGSSSVRDVALPDVDGTLHVPQEVARDQVHVVVFVSRECPIANAYAPVLRELAADPRHRFVRWFIAHVDPDVTAAHAREHARKYELPGAILLDPSQRLAKALGATRTPEAVVLNSGGMAYRGRIDDQWREPGARAPAATTHDLRLAVDLALRGGKVPAPHPPAVGCLLPEPRR